MAGKETPQPPQPEVTAPVPEPKTPVLEPKAPSLTPPTPEPTTNPFHRTKMDQTDIPDSYPVAPTENLDREKDYSKIDTIHNLVNDVLTGMFEMNMRSKRYRELFGKDLVQGFNFKAWLAGEGRASRDADTGNVTLQGGDFRIVHGVETPFQGTDIERRSIDSTYSARVEYNMQNEIVRRAAGVGWRVARQVGISSAIGLFTGGVGAACYWAAGGAAVGQGIVEGMRVSSKEEISIREKMEIARVRYFKKARELASRVGSPYAPEVAEGATENDYNNRRSHCLESLVNFVLSYERLGVDVEYDEDGNPYVLTEVRGEPMPQREGPESVNDPQQGIARGPAYNYGTELRQESETSPDAVLVRDLEDQNIAARKKWDRRTNIGGFVGGMAGIGLRFLTNSPEWIQNAYNHFQTQLKNGEIVKLDIDGDWKRHGVQMLNEKVGHMKDQFVYHMRNVGEQLLAHTKGAEILDPNNFGVVKEAVAPIENFGTHTLGATISQINQGVYAEAVKDIIIKIGQNAGAVALNSLWEHFNRKSFENRIKKPRQDVSHNQEQRRRDLQPDTVLDMLTERAEKNHVIMPQPGQVWEQPFGENQLHRIKILHVLKNGDAIVQHFDEKGKELTLDRRITLQDIMDNYHNLTMPERPERVYPQREGVVNPPPPPGIELPESAPPPPEPEKEKPKEDKEKKKIKVTIKFDDESGKEKTEEITLESGQIFSETIKKKPAYFEIIINDEGNIVKKPFRLKADGFPEYFKGSETTFNTVAFQEELNKRKVKREANTMSEFREKKKT